MASGKQHDRGIAIFTGVVGIATYYVTSNPVVTGIITASHLMGGLFLSPDLDLKSLPYYRWGILKFIWHPYQSAIPHRGNFIHRNPLSHAPIIGSVLRVLYLGAIAFLFMWLFDSLLKTKLGISTMSFLTKNIMILILAFIGLEVSAWVHLGMDIAATTSKGNYSRR